jgi:hypothetical protein
MGIGDALELATPAGRLKAVLGFFCNSLSMTWASVSGIFGFRSRTGVGSFSQVLRRMSMTYSDSPRE